MSTAGLLECVDVDKGVGKQGERKAQVSREAVHAMRAVRQVARGLPEIQDLQDMFQDAGERRQDSGCAKGKLVSFTAGAKI
jgi:hypothetical protein